MTPESESSLRSLFDSLHQEEVYPLATAQKALRRRGSIALSSYRPEELNDPLMADIIRQDLENNLNDYNDMNRHFVYGDEIMVSGDMYVRLVGSNGTKEIELGALYNPQYRITGYFDKIVSMPAPSQEQLSAMKAGESIMNPEIFAPAIRLTNLTISEFDGELTDEQKFERGSIDIPLHFTNMTLQRFEPLD